MKLENIIGNVIEGQSYTGKTTTAEAIKGIVEKGIILVPEYAVIGKLPIFPAESSDALKSSIQTILDLEKKRTEFLTNQLAQNSDSLVVFDRGPISCIAFQHAAEKNGYKGACLWLAEAFQKEFLDKNIIVPMGMCHFTATGNVIEKRERNDIQSGKGEILSFLKEDGVIKAINDTFAKFGTSLPNQLFLTVITDNKSPNQIAVEVLQFISGQQKITNIEGPDFINFAEKLATDSKS